MTPAPASVPLHCRGLTVAYGDVIAADDVTFDVGRGEIFGLLGPNGAGKTSVIRALTTIIEPRSGGATVAGAELDDPRSVRQAIGVLPESNGYPSSQTGLSYLTFHGELFGLTKAEAHERAGKLLALLGLDGVTQRIATYSRGMRQRLGLCRSLINEPAVLFLDEPTLGLDPAGKEEILTHLADIAVTHGMAVVLCTHLLDEVERFCDSVAILDRGHVVISGTVDDVIEAAPVGGNARVRLAATDDIIEARHVLADNPAIYTILHDNARPGDLDLALAPDAPKPATAILGALANAGIEVRGFDRNRGSLNDAFLALTAGLDTKQGATS